MKKGEFVRAIADDHSILREDALRIVEMVFGQLRKQLIQGKEVRIDDIGCFNIKFRKAGIMNNNLLGKRHPVPARVKLKFSTFPSMQRALNSILAAELDK